MWKYLIGGGVLIVLLVGSSWWTRSLQSQTTGSVIATNGLHWHPSLRIFVKGEEVLIPANVGLGAVHQPMHTHDDMPIIHLEFNGKVTEDDLKLGNFFRNWGKDMRSFGANMQMTVNGQVSTEYENYLLKDGDVVELRYE